MALTSRSNRNTAAPAPPTAEVDARQKDLQFLDRAFGDILAYRHGRYSFEELFSAAYRVIIEQDSERLYNSTSQTFQRHFRNNIHPVLQQAFADNPRNLHALLDQYERAMASIKQIASICLYLSAETRKQRIYDIFALGTKSMSDNCIHNDENIRTRLQETMLEMVERARRNEVVEAGLCKSACKMLVALGKKPPGSYGDDEDDSSSRRTYERLFENNFLKQSDNEFRLRAQELLATRSLEKFVDGVFERKQQEIELSRRMLHESTESRLVDVLHRSMVENYLPKLLDDNAGGEDMGEGIEFLIQTDNIPVLRRLYDLVRVAAGDDGIKSLVEAFEIVFVKHATLIITKDEKSPELAEQLILLGEKFVKSPESFSRQLFETEKDFEKTIRKAFENAIEAGKNKCSESLAFLADRLLQKSNKNMQHEQVKAELKKIVDVFCMLHDKDSFEGFYKQKLAKRLLCKNTFSEDLEQEVVNMLAAECGVTYAAKLKLMFQNLATSRTFNAEYVRPTSGEAAGIDFYVDILQSGAWPIKALQEPQLTGGMDASFKAFKEYYDKRQPNRKFQLVPSLGTAEVRATFYGPPQIPAGAAAATVPEGSISSTAASSSSSSSSAKIAPRTYLLLINTPQLIILNLFNSRSELTFEEILASTLLEEELCRRNLQALSMAKKQQQRILVLKRNSAAAAGASAEIAKTDSFRINDSFWSPQHRVKVQAIAAPPAQRAKEEQQVREQCVEDRKPVIDATLVRAMKARQKLSFSELISECVTLIKDRFKPDVLTIKARIEQLIEQEYFRRDENDRKILHYIA